MAPVVNPHLSQITLNQYRAERDTLLRQLQQGLAQDERIRAAWLWGSLGRGNADALSDLDLWIVVSDDACAAVVGQRPTYPDLVGTPLIIVDAPQNAPLNGAYLLTIYAGGTGPQQVDWYWQPQSSACVPPGVTPFLERDPLPRCSKETIFPGTQPLPHEAIAQIMHTVHFFWAMCLIAAKHVARAPHQPQQHLLAFVQQQLVPVQVFVDGSVATSALEADIASADPQVKMELLRTFARTMAALMPEVVARGGDVPTAIVAQAFRYFDLIDTMIQAQIT